MAKSALDKLKSKIKLKPKTLVGKQKNLDVNKNGKLDAQDFKILRGDEMAKGGEIKVIETKFNSHKNHNPNVDILEGKIDKDSFITYYVYVKGNDIGKEGMEYFVGSNYVVGSSKKSSSRRYDLDKIPSKYKKAWDKLKLEYNEKHKDSMAKGGETKNITVDDFFTWYMGNDKNWVNEISITDSMTINGEHAQDVDGGQKVLDFLKENKNEVLQNYKEKLFKEQGDYDMFFKVKNKNIEIGNVLNKYGEKEDEYAKGGQTKNKVSKVYFPDYIPEKSSKYYTKNSITTLAKNTNVKISDFVEKNVNNNIEFSVSGTKFELLKFMQTIFDAPDYSIEDLDYAIEMSEDEYKNGGELSEKKMIQKLTKQFEGKDLWEDEILDDYEVKMFDSREYDEMEKWKNKNSKKNYVVPFDSEDDSYTFILVPKNKMADGGETKEEEEDLFYYYATADYEKVPQNVQVILRKYDEAFIDSDYSEIVKAKKELNKIGYTFDIDSKSGGISSENLRKIKEKGGYMAKGGEVGDYFYDSRKDKPFVVIFEDGKNMGIQYLGKDKKEIGGVEKITKDTFEYNVSNGSWGKWKQAFEKGGYMAKGGTIAQENNDMLQSNIKEIKHHADELKDIVTNKTEVEPWVIAKTERASTDLSDVTHYLDGEKDKSLEMPFEQGGKLNEDDTDDYARKVYKPVGVNSVAEKEVGAFKEGARYANKIFADGGELSGLTANIFRSDYDSPTNKMYGKSNVTIIDEEVPEIFKPDESRPAVRLIRRKFRFGSDEYEYIHAVPYNQSDNAGMFGGTFIYSSDSRFPSKYPIPLHDRVEMEKGGYMAEGGNVRIERISTKKDITQRSLSESEVRDAIDDKFDEIMLIDLPKLTMFYKQDSESSNLIDESLIDIKAARRKIMRSSSPSDRLMEKGGYMAKGGMTAKDRKIADHLVKTYNMDEPGMAPVYANQLRREESRLNKTYGRDWQKNMTVADKANRFLQAVRVADNEIKLKDITVEASPRGNWVVFEHGKVIMTVNHDMLDEETIRTYNLEHHNS